MTFVGLLKSSVVCLLLPFTLLLPASAQDYPVRPVRIIVPATAGGTSDFVARLIAQKLTERLGQPFIVENRPGAASNTGAEAAARATPDGYTLFFSGVNTQAINPHLYKNLRYDHIRDFSPISLTCVVPNLLVVNPEFPAKTVPELIALLKSNPDKYAYGSTGKGTSIHMSAELFMLLTGTKLTHVPYNGSAQMVTDLMSGQIQLAFDNIVSSLPPAQSGKLRGLAVTTAERAAAAPEYPTMNDFLPGFDVSSWQGVLAPTGTPKAIIDKLNREIVAIVALSDVQERFKSVGATPKTTTPDQFSEYILSETKRWGDVIKRAGIQPE